MTAESAVLYEWEETGPVNSGPDWVLIVIVVAMVAVLAKVIFG